MFESRRSRAELRALIRRLANANPLWAHRYSIQDRDRIFAKNMDEAISRLGLSVQQRAEIPRHAARWPTCECMIGTIRRRCLDWLIPLSESNLRSILKEWVARYNGAHPHTTLCPGVVDLPAMAVLPANQKYRNRPGT